ncbi:hypothetical protein HNY73_007796 [Argiope bruennichi]|uniref:Uncharacterized protein n=1 Tax=Argiope bruennichi TaxID=94029 RepID=A0A8T0FM90_ARGBR|nr:hypothetical protein HNY73_007796 [Argiope bruennichi]
MQWFEECEDDSDINVAETTISDHEEKSEQESEENSNASSEEEEDDRIDMENYFYGTEPIKSILSLVRENLVAAKKFIGALSDVIRG